MKITSLPEVPACLNIGCGNFFFSEWTNVDLAPAKGVTACDIRKPLPFATGSFDVVYSSHVLEHLKPSDGKDLISEKFRLLKPGGICRLAVPDLENICREYLRQLEAAATQPNHINRQRYHWMMLELFDQIVREKPGGLMLETLEGGDFDEAFVKMRVGDELSKYYKSSPKHDVANSHQQPSLIRKLKRIIKSVIGGSNNPRESGEAHRWMYDRLSLQLLFQKIGFTDFAVKTYDDSAIPFWNKYSLDRSRDGDYPRKPDSLYVEAYKPV